MILMIPKSSYMPHDIQPDKILNISASTIALFLSFSVPTPPFPLATLPCRASNQEQNLHEIIFRSHSSTVVSCIRDKYLKKQNNCDSFFALWALCSLPLTLPQLSLQTADGQQIKIKSLITP